MKALVAMCPDLNNINLIEKEVTGDDSNMSLEELQSILSISPNCLSQVP